MPYSYSKLESFAIALIFFLSISFSSSSRSSFSRLIAQSTKNSQLKTVSVTFGQTGERESEGVCEEGGYRRNKRVCVCERERVSELVPRV